MNQSINYIQLLKRFKDSKKDGGTFLLENEIKEEVLTLLKGYIKEALTTNSYIRVLCDHTQLFDIEQVKIDLNEAFHPAIKRLETKLMKLKISAFSFMLDLNDLSQYDAFIEFDDDLTPFEKYCLTIAEFWLDAIDFKQGYFLREREQNAASIIETSYLKSIYSPYTVLGIKRFDKEREALFT
tara:strand:- start:1527 stop:2075 length:549 start_codon:yes stop_codon:yes gene_type:complete